MDGSGRARGAILLCCSQHKITERTGWVQRRTLFCTTVSGLLCVLLTLQRLRHTHKSYAVQGLKHCLVIRRMPLAPWTAAQRCSVQLSANPTLWLNGRQPESTPILPSSASSPNCSTDRCCPNLRRRSCSRAAASSGCTAAAECELFPDRALSFSIPATHSRAD